MDKQVIIAIGREYGSAGHEIAEKVAKDLGLKLYDRNMLDDIAKDKDIHVEYLEKYEEKPRRLFSSRKVGAYTNSIEEIIAEMQFDYLREKADSGESFVIVGRCAESVLKDREGLISIFILGNSDVKIKRIMNKYQLNETDAIAKIKRHDKHRKQYHNRYSAGKWGDSRFYDLCINSSKLGPDKTAIIIKDFIKERINTI